MINVSRLPKNYEIRLKAVGENGHPLDMHCGRATLKYSSLHRKYVLPGLIHRNTFSSGTLGYAIRTCTKAEAGILIRKMNALMLAKASLNA